VMPGDMLMNWKELVWSIAGKFNFQPDNIWNMYLDDFLFWALGVMKTPNQFEKFVFDGMMSRD
jgi:hypothetical protein